MALKAQPALLRFTAGPAAVQAATGRIVQRQPITAAPVQGTIPTGVIHLLPAEAVTVLPTEVTLRHTIHPAPGAVEVILHPAEGAAIQVDLPADLPEVAVEALHRAVADLRVIAEEDKLSSGKSDYWKKFSVRKSTNFRQTNRYIQNIKI